MKEINFSIEKKNATEKENCFKIKLLVLAKLVLRKAALQSGNRVCMMWAHTWIDMNREECQSN